MQEEKDIYHKRGHLDTAITILETPQRKEEDKGQKELQYLFIASATDFTWLGSSSKMMAYTYHRNGSTQSHHPLLQSRMSHLAQPDTKLVFTTSDITSMPYTAKEQQIGLSSNTAKQKKRSGKSTSRSLGPST